MLRHAHGSDQFPLPPPSSTAYGRRYPLQLYPSSSPLSLPPPLRPFGRVGFYRLMCWCLTHGLTTHTRCRSAIEQTARHTVHCEFKPVIYHPDTCSRRGFLSRHCALPLGRDVGRPVCDPNYKLTAPKSEKATLRMCRLQTCRTTRVLHPARRPTINTPMDPPPLARPAAGPPLP